MSKEFELRIINKPIYYIELIALLHRLVNERSYMEIRFDKEQNELLDLIKTFRIRGLELFELYLCNQNIDDMKKLEQYLFSLSPLDFLFQFFGDELTREEIQHLLSGNVSLQEAIKKSNFLASYGSEGLEFLFERTQVFIHRLVDIFYGINNQVVEQLMKQNVYQEALEKVSWDLKYKVPLDVAQSIMGKKFKRIYDFSAYYFVPSCFFMSKSMRTFNKHMQIVVYPIEQNSQHDKNTLADALKVIGDRTRLEIIQRLATRPKFGKELAAELGLGTSTVSHHLDQLRSIGLIHEERDKSVKYFSLNINEYNRLCEAMKGFIKN